MEKNETLYKRVEEGLYDIFSKASSVAMILGGAGTIAGLVTGAKELVDLYGIFFIGTAYKAGAHISEKRFESVPASELEKKVGR
ncbi:hypothetical protein FJZ53_02430 [Candidatus Woesearchaeota archaeon]|nr:hypothetical protein [Candidatus Woesearchaeota archaeon]